MSELFTKFSLTEQEKLKLRRKFCEKVFKCGDDMCHLWAGTVSEYGYGQLQITIRGKRRKIAAHRLAFFISRGYSHLPLDMHVSHLCHNKLCVNVNHLSLEPANINLGRTSCVRNRRCLGHHGYPNCKLSD